MAFKDKLKAAFETEDDSEIIQVFVDEIKTLFVYEGQEKQRFLQLQGGEDENRALLTTTLKLVQQSDEDVISHLDGLLKDYWPNFIFDQQDTYWVILEKIGYTRIFTDNIYSYFG